MIIYREVKGVYTIPKYKVREELSMPTLRQLREQAVLTQAEVAEKIGVSVTTISHWETGSKRPRVGNIRKLAETLGITPQDVLAAVNQTVSVQDEN